MQVDRAYIGAPSPLKLQDSGRGSVLMIHKHGFADAVVWNPAESKAAGMGDLGADNWRGFVCVEVARALAYLHPTILHRDLKVRFPGPPVRCGWDPRYPRPLRVGSE